MLFVNGTKNPLLFFIFSSPAKSNTFFPEIETLKSVIPLRLLLSSIAKYISVPFTVKGKGGSVTIEILPGPRGLGLVAGGKIRNLLKLAGVKDAWTHTKGSTATMNSTSKALLECLRQTFSQG